MQGFIKKLTGYLFFFTLLFLSPTTVFAESCTYKSTLTNNHIDVLIQENDWSNLGVLEIIANPQPTTWGQMSQPSGPDWKTSWGALLPDTYFALIGGNHGETAYWGFNGYNQMNTIPYGTYGVDFIGSILPDNYFVQVNHPEDVGTNYVVCTRTGDIVTSTPTPTPSPTPSPTVSPSPTPSASPSPSPTITPSPTATSTPVTKVFLLPGMGASWNVDAFMNCKNSGYSGGWTLAPYAKDVYKEILTQLPSHGWTTFPLNYDWRQDIRNNTPILTNLINSNTTSNEKVNIVGHSMGGLIGRYYLEAQSGGKALKFLAVGSPFQGSALAYPALINGEIWTDDLVEKIGTTLFFNRCGTPQSFKNILPTYNYLRDSQTGILKDVNTQKTKNNYLPTTFASPFWGVKVGTLAGSGKSTLKIIKVKNDSKWTDGKPVGQENVSDGDGTVLTQSVQIPGAFSNNTINQTHTGIIASTEGVGKVLEFLGSPGIVDPPYSDPKSALILIGYPGTFWVTDKNGNTTQSDQGMIALMNPMDGDYQLQIIPTSTTTNFIVGQFLPNGKTEYKEYKFKGLIQDPKIIKFDSRHSNADILHEAREYNKPNFPKFWLEFWKYWNKFHR